MDSRERIKIIESLLFPTLLVAIMWLVKIAELIFDTSFATLGVYPQKLSGLPGIFLSPFIHGNLAHLSANTIPIWVLGSVLLYFYREIAWKVLLLIYVVTGLWVWAWARESYHIGMSGIIYGLASFLFFSGIFRREGRLMAISFLVIFLYGSLIWGIFPQLFPKENISWESHLMGLIAGLAMAIFYRKEGPQPKRYSWEIEDEDGIAEDDPNAYWNQPPKKKKEIDPVPVNYIYKETDATVGQQNEGKNPDSEDDKL